MTPTQRKAMQDAIEAFIASHYAMIDAGMLKQDVLNTAYTAVEALRNALKEDNEVGFDKAEPAQEPVTWSMTYNGNHCGNFYESRTDAEERMADMNAKHPLDKRAIEPLYAAPVHGPAEFALKRAHDLILQINNTIPDDILNLISVTEWNAVTADMAELDMQMKAIK